MSVDEAGSSDDRIFVDLPALEWHLFVWRSGDESPDPDSVGTQEFSDAGIDELRDCFRLLEEDMPRGARRAGLPTDRIGRFEILGELGRGVFRVVLRAFDPSLKRQVALKVPRPEYLAKPGARKRFLRAGWAASRLDHPNIVSVLEAGEAGPIGYMASALCEGPCLSAWLTSRSTPVPPSMAARLIAELAGAIEHAHGRGGLHRDLKPANILLQEGEIDTPSRTSSDALPLVPRICDFGLAKLLEPGVDDTRSVAVLGSPSYMALEQAEGRSDRVGPAADIHGLGAIL